MSKNSTSRRKLRAQQPIGKVHLALAVLAGLALSLLLYRPATQVAVNGGEIRTEQHVTICGQL